MQVCREQPQQKEDLLEQWVESLSGEEVRKLLDYLRKQDVKTDV